MKTWPPQLTWSRLWVITLMMTNHSISALEKGITAPSPLASPGPVMTEFHDVIERDFPLRSHAQLQVTNMRGDIVIQGWSLDKIRVKARRKALAVTNEDAKHLFSAVDFRFSDANGQLELAAEYGRGLTLEERLREREHPRTGMEMVVYAPAHLKLRIWGVDGKITLKGWNAAVDARASSGAIQIEHVKSGGVSVLCPSCGIRLSSIQGPVRCMGESGAITLTDADSSQVYVESSTGPIQVSRVKGEQLYVTKDGRLTGSELHGRIEFHGGSSPVEILESEGFLSGRTVRGDIVARMREWEFADKAVIESLQGNIRLTLPSDFSGEVDLFSGKAPVESGFLIERSGTRNSEVVKLNHLQGRIGDGGELLKMVSSGGSVRLIRGQ